MNEFIKCPNCKGKGYTRDIFGIIVTLGIPNILDGNNNGLTSDHCKYCDCKGYIKVSK